MEDRKYRPELDGLRGFALGLVLAYHFFPKYLAGGFIGVDVFFVLSGYLINTQLIELISRGKFSILDFFQRRILRIFPALIITLIIVLVLGYVSLLAIDYKAAGNEVFYGAFFLANLKYMHDGSYFDLSQHFKPLLNLWSLGIEEQFYILWPIILYFCLYFKIRIFIFTLILATISFGINIYISGVNVNMAFYSPYSRIWEILAGALLAFSLTNEISYKWKNSFFYEKYIHNSKMKLGEVIYEYLFFISIFFVVVISVKLGRTIGLEKFPGVIALVPVFFAVVSIIKKKSHLKNLIFNNRYMIKLGLISYPIYLIHWPILSFFISVSESDITLNQSILLVIFSVLGGAIIYHYVEVPIRNQKNRNFKTIVLCIMLISCGFTGYVVYKLNGIEKRNDENLIMSVDFIEKERLRYWNGEKEVNFLEGKPKIIVFGDSHAYDIFASLKNDNTLGLKIFPSYHFCYGFTSSFEKAANKKQECKNYFKELLESKEIRKADILIYGHLWNKELEIENTYADAIKKIQNINPNIKIFFFGLKPMLVSGVGMTPIIHIIQKHPSRIGMNEYLNSVKVFRSSDDDYVKSLAVELGVNYIDVKTIFCDDQCPFFVDGNFSYFDQVHWTESGGKIFNDKLKKSTFYDLIR